MAFTCGLISGVALASFAYEQFEHAEPEDEI